MHLPHWIVPGLLPLLVSTSMAAAPLVIQEGEPLQLAELDFESATSRAEREEKFLVILWVEGPESPAALKFRAQLFGDDGVKTWVRENAVAVRIDAKVDREGARRNSIKRYPCVDILDFVRGGRVGRLTTEDTSLDFLATVYGATTESGQARKPEGEAAKEPFSWLSWANTRFRAVEPQGRKDAVNGYTWCLRRADDFRPGFRARYLEFLLERISSAKMDAPEAVDILMVEANQLSSQIYAGTATRQTVYDYVRVNKWRRKDLETRDLFLKLEGRGPEVAAARRWLFPAAVPTLGRYQQYEAILSEVGDEALLIFKSRIDSLSVASATVPAETEGPAGTDGDRPGVVAPLPFSVPDTRAQIIDEASWVYEALLAQGRGSDARALFELVSETYPIARTYGLFMERCLRLEFWKLAAEIGDLGMSTLDARGQRRMQRLLQKIPQTSDEPEDDGSGR